MLILIIFIILAIGYSLYIYWIRKIHDLSIARKVPSDLKREDGKTNILFIYPHPDDETMASGGLMHKLSTDKNFNVYAIDITHGEKGDEILKLNEDELAKVRAKEFHTALSILNIKQRALWDLPDGEVTENEIALKSKLKEFIEKNKIAIVVTYEKFGLYGHPDHTMLSKVVHDLSHELAIDVLYATLPDKILKRIKLPAKLTYKDKVVELSSAAMADPEFRIDITSDLIAKYRAARAYKSQKLSHHRPLWMSIFFMNQEYYTRKY